jgi:enoyl-CoA hydratase/carnithine racemase
MTALVERSDAAAVATLTLNRPDKLNAINTDMFLELRRHIDDLAGDENVGAVVLTGAGEHFGAGNDLAQAGGRGEGPARHFKAETVDALEALPQTTIAKVRGYCLTGSLEVALGCDLIIAGESAQFADTHGRWGFVPAWGMSVRLPERIGVPRAKLMAVTGRRISGAEAAAWGLAQRCVPDPELDGVVAEICEQIVANSWDTNRMMKKLYVDQAGMSRDAALKFERSAPYGMPRDMQERLQRRPGT